MALGATGLEEVGTLLAVTYMVQSVNLFTLANIGIQQSASDDSSGGTKSEDQRNDRRQRRRLAIALYPSCVEVSRSGPLVSRSWLLGALTRCCAGKSMLTRCEAVLAHFDGYVMCMKRLKGDM